MSHGLLLFYVVREDIRPVMFFTDHQEMSLIGTVNDVETISVREEGRAMMDDADYLEAIAYLNELFPGVPVEYVMPSKRRKISWPLWANYYTLTKDGIPELWEKEPEPSEGDMYFKLGIGGESCYAPFMEFHILFHKPIRRTWRIV
jgi:hypothetical protein